VTAETSTRMSVMVVDDSADLRMLISRVIERRSDGWQVVAQAADGRQAIDAATAHDIDLVLLDIAMPVMDGMEALPHIREAAPDAVVVMISGFPFAVAGQGALDAGADGYLEKTDLVKKLVPQLEEIISDVRSS
jgi:CheY-like chemotaxis protein